MPWQWMPEEGLEIEVGETWNPGPYDFPIIDGRVAVRAVSQVLGGRR
jgi:hypothetical protein